MAISSIRRIAVAACLAALLSAPSAAAAAPTNDPHPSYPPTPGSLFLSPTHPAAGGSLYFVGTGFLPREQVAARLDRRLLRIVRADRLGVARGMVVVPRRTPRWRQVFSLTGLASGQRLYAYIVARRSHYGSAAPATDAQTGIGADVGPASVDIAAASLASQVAPPKAATSALPATGGAAAALVTLGGGVYLLRRRRREATPRR